MSLPGNQLVPAHSKNEIDPEKMEAKLKEILAGVIKNNPQVEKFAITSIRIEDRDKTYRISIGYQQGVESIPVKPLIAKLFQTGENYIASHFVKHPKRKKKFTNHHDWFFLSKELLPQIMDDLAKSEIKRTPADAPASSGSKQSKEGNQHPVLGGYSHAQPAQQAFMAPAAPAVGGSGTTATLQETAVVTPPVASPSPP